MHDIVKLAKLLARNSDRGLATGEAISRILPSIPIVARVAATAAAEAIKVITKR